MRERPNEAALRGWRRLLPLLALLLALTQGAVAQQAVPPPWASELEVRRRIEPPPGAQSPPAAPASASPAAPGGAQPTPLPLPGGDAAGPRDRARLTLSAFLTQDGEPIDQGLVWRVYTEVPGSEPPQPRLIDTRREAIPVVTLAPGNYLINVAYGRAHLTRRIAVADTRPLEERFVLNAGGLRVTAVLGTSEKMPDLAASFDVFQGDADQLGGRTKVAGALRPNLIIRLNAGLYHIVSTLGDANATVSADVTVEAGKLTDAVVSHHAARVSFKLVTRAGGEAQAGTQWSLHTLQGDLVRETQGALPTHILAAGQYIASARHGGRLYQKQFTVASGEPTEVEIVMQ